MSEEEKRKIKLDKKKEYYQKNKEKWAKPTKEYSISYYQKNKERIKEKNQINPPKRKRNKEKQKIYMKEYRLSYSKDKKREQDKQSYQRNKESRKKSSMSYHKNRKEVDVLYKLTVLIRTRIYQAITYSGYTKRSRTYEILGCSYEEFKIHLESKFESWMTWDNQGQYNGELDFGWDMDHIIPVSSAKTEEEIIKLNHYTNLQPLCSKVNRDIKKDKLTW